MKTPSNGATALLLDIGNVLLRFDFRPAVERIASRARLDAAGVLAASDALKHAYEDGRIGRQAFLAGVAEAIGYEGSEADLVRDWVDIFSENRPMTDLVRALHGRLPMYLLSNTNDLHLEWIRNRYPVFECLTEGIYSHEAGCSKPSVTIFERAFEKFGLDPASTVYVDDLGVNIDTGLRLGLRCVQYDPDRHDDAVVEMRRHGIPV